MDKPKPKPAQAYPMLAHAIAYARKGWRVLPLAWPISPGLCSCRSGRTCSSVAKHPITEHGVTDATTSKTQIEIWWSRWPEANIGLAAGSESGFIVLDVDGPDGARELGQLFTKHGQVEPTPVSLTAHGRHIFWKYFDAPNRVRIAPGLDIRSQGGYVVAPPSIHTTGVEYLWHPDGHPGKVKLQAAPWWLPGLICKTPKPKPQKTYRAKFNLERVAQIPAGTRNDALFRMVAKMIGKQIEQGEAYNQITWLNANRCDPPLPDREVDRLVACAYRRYG